MLISVILSTLNERDNIVALAQSLEHELQRDYEILVIDDHSEDGTFEAISQYAQNRPAIRPILRQERGLTSAIQKGIDLAQGEIICWMDADFSHPPELVGEMREILELGQADCVVASRFLKASQDHTHQGSPFIYFHKLLSHFLSYACRLLLAPHFRDWSSGFIAIKATVLKQHPFRGDYGEYFMELIFALFRHQHRVREIPFISPPRRFGRSKTANNLPELIARGHKYLLTLARLFALKLRVVR